MRFWYERDERSALGQWSHGVHSFPRLRCRQVGYKRAWSLWQAVVPDVVEVARGGSAGGGRIGRAGIGKEEDAMPDGFVFPDNFIVKRFLPQKHLLPVIDCFISHGGANSLQESLISGTPLVVMPFFGDQFENGESIARMGAGTTFDSPVYEEAKTLCDSIMAVATQPCYKSKALEAQALFQRAWCGGSAGDTRRTNGAFWQR